MYGRRSAGKRIRMDEQGQEQQGQYDQYGNYQYGDQQQSYGNPSGAQEQADQPFDPVAFYQQQRSEMLLESSHHVQQSQDEIQRAQLEAQQREQQMEGSKMGRGSRSAAAAAKAAMSMMTEDERPAQVPSPTTSPARQTRPRVSRTSFASSSRRGRPAGTSFKNYQVLVFQQVLDRMLVNDLKMSRKMRKNSLKLVYIQFHDFFTNSQFWN